MKLLKQKGLMCSGVAKGGPGRAQAHPNVYPALPLNIDIL